MSRFTVRAICAWPDRVSSKLFPYDPVVPLGRRYARVPDYVLLLFVPLLVAATGLALIALGEIDNQGHVCSSTLPHCGSIAQDFGTWITTKVWTGVTPTPMHNACMALIFYVFGYTTAYAVAATFVISMTGCYLLGVFTVRRFGMVAALLSQVLYVTVGVVMTYSLSGGYYLWATTPLLGALCALDLYERRKSRVWYFGAALLILVAGMSRPEVFALGLVIVILVQAPLWARILFLLIAWAFPAAVSVISIVNKVPPQSAIKPRVFETYAESLAIWTKETGVVFSDAFGTNWMVLVIAGLIVFLFRRHRFYATLAISYTLLFLLLHLVGRLEQNFPHYYIGVITLFLPAYAYLLAAFPAKFAKSIAANRGSGRVAWNVLFLAISLAVSAYLFHPVQRFEAITSALSYKEDAGIRELRDYIKENIPKENVLVFDYFGDMTWVLAETYVTPPRKTWAYYLNRRKDKPFHGISKDPQKIEDLNRWTQAGFEDYVRANGDGAFFVTLSDQRWNKVKHSPHYKSNSLKGNYSLTESEKERAVSMEELDVTFRQEAVLGDFLIYTIYTSPKGQAVEAP